MEIGQGVIAAIGVLALLMLAVYVVYRGSAEGGFSIGNVVRFWFKGSNRPEEGTSEDTGGGVGPGAQSGDSEIMVGPGAQISNSEFVAGDKTTVTVLPASLEAPAEAPLPKLVVKLFLPRDRAHRDKIVIDQTGEGSHRYVFGCALENRTKSTIAKEIDLTLRFSWRGDDPGESPCFKIKTGRTAGWNAQEPSLHCRHEAVLIFGDSDLRCPYRQSREWADLSVSVSQRVRGYFEVRYRVSSARPLTENSDTLKIVMR